MIIVMVFSVSSFCSKVLTTIKHLEALWTIPVRKPNKATCLIIVKDLPAAEHNQAALTLS